MTCAVVIHVRCLTVIFLLYIVGLSQKNGFVRDQNDDMSEEDCTSGWPYCCITHQPVHSYMYMYTKYIIEKLSHYAQKVHRYMQHQTMYNLTHNRCLSYMYSSANATSAVHERICNA